MIRLGGIRHRYGAHDVLRDIHLEVAEGEFLGIVGPNSAGKSTLLKIIGGDIRPVDGNVTLLNTPLQNWATDDLARTMAVVSSEEYFVFPFRAEEIVRMGRSPHLPRWRREGEHDRQIIRQSMESTDVWNLRDRSVDQLSSGERQRVLLARALAQEPKILLLDEPTAHLDIGHEWDVFTLLRDLHAKHSLTVVCILHDLLLAAAFCDRLLLLHEGTIAAQGAPKDVLTADRLSQVFGSGVPASLMPAITLTLRKSPVLSPISHHSIDDVHSKELP